MKILIAIFLMMFSAQSFAQETRASFSDFEETQDVFLTQIFLLNFEMRYERDASQDFVERQPLNFGVAIHDGAWSGLLEYSRYSEDSGNATSMISRTHEEGVLWGRYHFWRIPNSSGTLEFNMYGGVALGGYQEKVTTTLMGSSQTDNGTFKFMSGLAAGIEFSALLPNKKFGVVADLEGRALASSDFDPNPLWGAVFRFGLQF
jgi:hypothetical protein